MCWFCDAKASLRGACVSASPAAMWAPRRAFLLAAGASMAAPALAQVQVGPPADIRKLVPAAALEDAARQEYAKVVADARQKGILAASNDRELERLRTIANRLIPFATQWNDRAAGWKWEINLIKNKEVNAWCMPGGKIAFYTGILDQMRLTDDEAAMVLGHEMAHALREHARERLAKTEATGFGLSVAAQLFGLGQAGNVAANLGTKLLSLKYSRDDETEADLVGLEIGARGGFRPAASVELWNKMIASGGGNGPGFLSTHPSGSDRIRLLEENVPKVQGLYENTLQAAGARPTRGNKGKAPPSAATPLPATQTTPAPPSVPGHTPVAGQPAGAVTPTLPRPASPAASSAAPVRPAPPSAAPAPPFQTPIGQAIGSS